MRTLTGRPSYLRIALIIFALVGSCAIAALVIAGVIMGLLWLWRY